MSMTERQADEITIVRYLSKRLRCGLKGQDIDEILYSNPQANVLAGVLFSRELFENISSDDASETQKRQTVPPLTKNCSLGLDFLVEDNQEALSLNVDCSFDLYVRVFPTFEEQLHTTASIISNIDADFEDEDEEQLSSEEGELDSDEQTVKEIAGTRDEYSIAEKYKKITVSLYELKVTVTPLENSTITLTSELITAINDAKLKLAKEQGSIYAVSNKKTKIQGPWTSEAEYLQALELVRTCPTLPEWKAEINISTLPQIGCKSSERRLNVILTNTTPLDFDSVHPIELFNCSISVKIQDTDIKPFEFENVESDYRYDKRFFGLGINCVAERTEANELRSETIPAYFQSWYRTSDNIKLNFTDLENDTDGSLSMVSASLNNWLLGWEDYINNGYQADGLSPDQLEQCRKDKAAFVNEIESFNLGYFALKTDDRLLKAFKLMNHVFSIAGKGKYISWRLFQLIFIVRLIPSLAARESSNAEFNKVLENVDILWFPTGGGKTEAYLGLIICSLFYDRLRGKKKGTTAWLRFPLRMLSKQQLERLARVLAIAEQVRTSSEIHIEKQGEPFSMGYFVGSGNTPNFISESEMKKYMTDEQFRQYKIQLHRCPFCNNEIKMEVDTDRWRLVHRCINEECYSNQQPALKNALPLYISDSEIYRFLPSVICGTVDKLAILGRYGEFSHIFGQVDQKCPKHGYFSGGACLEKRYGSRACSITTKGYEKVSKEIDPCPSLLIQDELHLLKEELGVFDGHYEGFLQSFAKKIGINKPPKILAATATIEAYEIHTTHLYNKEPVRYPVPGYKHGETFYATSTPVIPRRLFLGVLSHLKSLEETTVRCLRIYHEVIQQLRNNAQRMMEDIDLKSFSTVGEFQSWLDYYDLSTVYVNRKQSGQDIDYRIQRVLNPQIQGELGYVLNSTLITGNEDMGKIGSVIEKIEKDRDVRLDEKLHCLIATSLISHGVDLERINAFFMAGMPSKNAEYIQASSRSARTHAGLVVVCFNAKELRERSQYVYFVQNHKFQDRLVEPVPINRLATYSFDKTVPGLLSGLLLGLYSRLLWNRHKSLLETAGEVQKVLKEENNREDQLLSKEQLIADLIEIIGANDARFSVSLREEAKERIAAVAEELLELIRRTPGDVKIKEDSVLKPMTSFRDVDEGISFIPNAESAIVATYIRSK